MVGILNPNFMHFNCFFSGNGGFRAGLCVPTNLSVDHECPGVIAREPPWSQGLWQHRFKPGVDQIFHYIPLMLNQRMHFNCVSIATLLISFIKYVLISPSRPHLTLNKQIIYKTNKYLQRKLYYIPNLTKSNKIHKRMEFNQNNLQYPKPLFASQVGPQNLFII